MKKTFTGKTRLFLCISGAIIAVALILQVCGLGLNLGIDFTGGSILEYSVGEDYDAADVETILAELGFEDAQVTKAAPSAASEMLQANLAAEKAAAAELSAEDAAAVESGEAHVHEDGTVHYGDHTEEAAEEPAEATASIISMDKSGVKADGLTDLQIRLRLVDEAADMESCIAAAVEGTLLDYARLTTQAVTDNGYDPAFTGGYALRFDMGGEFDMAAAETAVNAALAEGGYSIRNIAFSAIENGMLILVDLDDTTSQVRSVLETEMKAKYENFHFVSIDHVSAIAGRDLIANAVKALLVAFALMLVYIAIRFDPMSGLAALFGLMHDVLIMCSFMVFFRGLFQANSPFIAAVLTIVGYSINNTIIIFDRIRENAKKPGLTQKPRMEIVEMSVASTLSRTINTTLTTMITLVALYVFGVESIREFAFPLIVGMLAGTYSSVLLSGQVWAIWTEKLAARKAAAKAAEKQA